MAAGKKEIDEEIGHGGMATVYRARERKHERPVVLKVLKPETAVAFGAERFLAEIHVAAQLSHPHILALLDSGEADGLLYYVMPWLGGETLRTRLRRERRLPVATGCRILRDLADALASAHRAGVVHRDLKPENILLVGDHAYLLDFGIAQLRMTDTADRVTGEGTVVGTMGYMAPEQEAGVHTDHRADIFALGVVGRELLTGMEPGLFTSILPETLPPETPAALGTLHSSLQIAGIVLALSFTTLVVDLTRVRVVLDGARGLHPRTFLRAMVTAARAPGLWLRSGLVGLLHWAIALAMLVTAVHGLDTAWSPWAVRGSALLATFVALWRLAVAVEYVATAPRPPAPASP